MPSATARALPDPFERKRLHCSFCGKDAGQVRFLSAGAAGGMICDGCCLAAFAIFVKAHLAAAFRFGRA